jgi:membrane dipeptidase
MAIGFDLEGAMPLLEQIEMVALYASLGVRQIHFAYNRNNSVADGCHDVQRGLTPLGRRMVEAVNAAGLLMDCSHTGRRCSLDIMAASSQPVVFSHANPLALVEHGRNISDEQIRACAATGGVVCVSGVSRFLGSLKPTAQDVARHAAYVAGLVGVQHVGIGLDIGFSEPALDDSPPGVFDRGYWWPNSAGYGNGIADIRYAPVDTWRELDAALHAHGLSADEAALVMGGNMLRVAQQVWSSGQNGNPT